MKSLLALAFSLITTVFTAAQIPNNFSTADVFALRNNQSSVNQMISSPQNLQSNSAGFHKSGLTSPISNLLSAKCTDSADGSNVIFAPTAAPCNGVSVTAINFNNTGRTVESGTTNTVGVVYRYPNVGTAPDGTALDALVTVQSYSNNQDANQTNFTDADVPGATIGFEGNLQPNINQENATHTAATSWSGAITYRIQFVVTGTSTAKRISVAATTIDNDGANACGGTNNLRESVTLSPAPQQFLLSTTPATLETIAGNTVQGPNTNQAGVGIGPEYSAAGLYLNITEMNWTYSFATGTTCTGANGTASPARYGSLNLSCQINFPPGFVSFPLSGNVYNDTNGLTDSTVNGTGTGTPSATQLYANLVDGNGFVVSSVAVAANGTYSFPTAVNGTYTVQISTTQGVESSTAPAIALPAGWVNTGEFLGAGAGNDGTTNGLSDGSLAVTVNGAAVTNANFGIEQRPTAANNTAATQTNPGGTISATVPATTFSGTDTAPGTVSNIRITAFPSNATSLTVGTTTYYATTVPGTCPTATCLVFPGGGVTVPTNAAGNPTQAILVDPFNGAVTVVIPYVTLDNAGIASAAATASVPFATVSLSGTVFNDTNGLQGTPANTVDGTGTNAGGLFANLLDSGGNVVASVAVPANGIYSFAGLNSGSYSVQISTNAGTVGNPAPATALPAGWVNTGEFLGAGAGNDGTTNGLSNGLLAVTVGATNVTNANFGIEQRPTANNNTAASQGNPGGATNATVPATTFSGADAGTNTVSSIRISTFPTNATTITINGTVYGAVAGPGVTAFPAGGVTTPTNAAGNPTQAILVDPVDGAVTVVITYFAIDAAGVESSASATASVPFTTLSISGNVFNDTNGLNGTPANTVDGTGTNAGGLFANLLDSSGNVVQSVAIPAGGTYSFSGLNGGSYSVQISTNAGTVGNPAPATVTPAGWVNTGEFLGAGAGNDGVINGLSNGLLAVPLGTTNVTNANFGIEQRPTANSANTTTQTNPGGTISATVPATTFSATDPTTATVSSIRITAFPSNATSLTVGTTTYYATTVPGTCPTATCLVFPGGGVTVPTNAAGNPTSTIQVDPIDGGVRVNIPYVAVDAAGVESSTVASVGVPFFGPTAANGNISGALRVGRKPVRNALVVLTDTGSNSKVFTRTDNNGNYLFSDKEAGRVYIIEPLSGKYSFSPSTLIVNLLDTVEGQNFNSTEKTYHPKNDFDGDGKTDIAVFRPADGNWYVLKSSDGQMSVFHFGMDGDTPAAADYDGDGKTDYAVFRASEGIWYIWQSATQQLYAETFGASDDKIVPADFDGDGKADLAVYRSGYWYVHRSSDNALEAKSYGDNSDTPVAADFDGDRKTDFTVFRPADGMWFTLNGANNSSSATHFGQATDVPVAGDFDGDGVDDIAQFRNGYWFIMNSTTKFEAEQFGSSEDRLAVGDYDGDGRSDLAIYRNGLWVIKESDNSNIKYVSFGSASDVLVK